jgi:hypothetical protein
MSTPLETRAAPESPRVRISFAWPLLAVSGIAFWFLLGFPFGHHNESYDWVAWIETPNLASVAWHHFFGAGGYRPLAMTVAWFLYRVADGSLVPIQLFNFATTALAWWTLCRAANAPRTFALAALVSGGVLFAGYLYLFHLHGVFYGPMLLWLACAIRAYLDGMTRNRLGALSLAALFVVMFHPYTIVFDLALVGGSMIELGWLKNPRARWVAIAAGIVGAIFIFALSPATLYRVSDAGLRGLVTSFRATEVKSAVSLVCLLLAGATMLSTRFGSRSAKFAGWIALGAGAVVLAATHFPFAPLWLVACLVKACVHRRWTLAFLLAVSLGLPYAGATGSPTYAVFALTLGTVVTAVDWVGAERVLDRVRPVHALAVVGLLVALGATLRAGVHVPVVSTIAHPVLAESERTHQMEELLRQFLASPWRDRPVLLENGAPSPTEAEGALDRQHRPPTQQICLDAFLLKRRGPPRAGAPPVILSFGGGARVSNAEKVLTVPGRYAGEATAHVVPESIRLPMSGPEI